MKFTSLLISLIFSFFFSAELGKSVFQLALLCEKRNEIRQSVLCRRFISRSFSNTCEGKGFKNLEEWEKVCKAMWKLDSINFYMEEKGTYGRWVKESEKYEVYYSNEQKCDY